MIIKHYSFSNRNWISYRSKVLPHKQKRKERIWEIVRGGSTFNIKQCHLDTMELLSFDIVVCLLNFIKILSYEMPEPAWTDAQVLPTIFAMSEPIFSPCVACVYSLHENKLIVFGFHINISWCDAVLLFFGSCCNTERRQPFSLLHINLNVNYITKSSSM